VGAYDSFLLEIDKALVKYHPEICWCTN